MIEGECGRPPALVIPAAKTSRFVDVVAVDW